MRRNSHPSTAGIVLFAAATMVSGLFFTHDVFAKEDVREAALRAAELTRFQAQVDVDTKALTQLLDDELEYTHSNGELDSKTSFIESLTSGRRDYVSTTATIETVRIFGDVAIIRGKAKVTVADNGQSRDLDLGYTDVWVWKDKRWQMTAWRSARMPPPAPAPRGDEASARLAVQGRFDAALRGDVHALEQLLADDLEYCGVSGTCSSKAQYLDSVRSGVRRFRTLVPKIERVTLHADSAVLTGSVTSDSIYHGVERHIEARLLIVLAWRDGRWQMTHQASTNIEHQAK